MSFPSIPATLDILGRHVRDRVSGATGIATCVTFDLYGCVQVAIHQGLDNDGKVREQFWFDIQRLEVLAKPRVMEPPRLSDRDPFCYENGPADKPPPRAV